MMSDTTREELAFERAETDYKRGVRAAVLIIAGLCGLSRELERMPMTRAQVGRLALLAWFLALWILAVIACLSGCKITYRTLPCECAQRDMR